MIDPSQLDIGRAVIYLGGIVPERGVITSMNAHYVFVRYALGGSGWATPREDLIWEIDPPRYGIGSGGRTPVIPDPPEGPAPREEKAVPAPTTTTGSRRTHRHDQTE